MLTGYDIIGDIHGQADKLRGLLHRLGYRTGEDGFFKHPDRQIIFVGDFVDRHPQQKETLEIIQSMVDGGAALAVMGNHEFNAICFATPHPHDGHVRKHTSGNINQHKAFLKEFPQGSQPYQNQIAWFKTLPVYLDLKDIFVIHACWHPPSIEVIQPHLNPDKTLKDDAYIAFADRASPLFSALEILLKGPDHKIPDDIAFYCKDGIRRHNARVSWWVDDSRPTSQRLEHRQGKLSDNQTAHLDKTRITHIFNQPAKPTFIGHYWMSGTPAPLNDKICCVDYSAAAHGPLMAYRWSGESILTPAHFSW